MVSEFCIRFIQSKCPFYALCSLYVMLCLCCFYNPTIRKSSRMYRAETLLNIVTYEKDKEGRPTVHNRWLVAGLPSCRRLRDAQEIRQRPQKAVRQRLILPTIVRLSGLLPSLNNAPYMAGKKKNKRSGKEVFLSQQEGKVPIDLRQQWPWKITLWCFRGLLEVYLKLRYEPHLLCNINIISL